MAVLHAGRRRGDLRTHGVFLLNPAHIRVNAVHSVGQEITTEPSHLGVFSSTLIVGT